MGFTSTLAGELLLLQYMLNNSPATNINLHLYSNNWVPTVFDGVNNYTEPTAAGYTYYAMPGSQWTFATVAGTSAANYAQQSFTFSTSAAAYGYYITDHTNTQLFFASEFQGAPFQLPVNGGTINVTPQIGLGGCS